KLPESTGVYYFYNKVGKILYVGKAINIKARITSHFSGKSETRLKPGLINDIHSIGFELCGNELLALLLECNEIKKYWPPYNNSHKRNTTNTGIYMYEDIAGFRRLCISPVKKFEKPVYTFHNIAEARNFLVEKCEEHKLCPRLCGLQKVCSDQDCDTNGICNTLDFEQIERYNLRLLSAISTLDSEKSFILSGKGKTSTEKSFVMIENGRYQGFGYYPTDSTFYSPQELKTHLQSYPDNPDIQRIINSYVRNNSQEIEYLPFAV
ncbi:MAG TPA: GIY-YIG nuclease family protein, partial [Cytophagaceae bacterium]